MASPRKRSASCEGFCTAEGEAPEAVRIAARWAALIASFICIKVGSSIALCQNHAVTSLEHRGKQARELWIRSDGYINQRTGTGAFRPEWEID